MKIQSSNESLVTVLRLVPGKRLDRSFLEQKVAEFSDLDDVFCIEFMQGLCVCHDPGNAQPIEFDDDTKAYMSSLGNEWIQHIDPDDKSCDLGQGVYLASNNKLFEVYRLYADVQGAFTQTFIPGPDG